MAKIKYFKKIYSFKKTVDKGGTKLKIKNYGKQKWREEKMKYTELSKYRRNIKHYSRINARKRTENKGYKKVVCFLRHRFRDSFCVWKINTNLKTKQYLRCLKWSKSSNACTNVKCTKHRLSNTTDKTKLNSQVAKYHRKAERVWNLTSPLTTSGITIKNLQQSSSMRSLF